MADYGQGPCDSIEITAKDIDAVREFLGANYRVGDEIRRDTLEGAMQRAVEKEEKRLEHELDRAVVEKARKKVWAVKGSSMPGDEPRPDGVCRHKVQWLIAELGAGKMVSGFRTDRADTEYHAAFAFTDCGREFVADYDKVWPAEAHPFCRYKGDRLTDWEAVARRWNKPGKIIRSRRDEDGNLLVDVFDGGSEPPIPKRVAKKPDHQDILYKGVFDPKRTYKAGEMSTHRGGLWVAKVATAGGKPGDGSGSWQLAVKSGEANKVTKRREIDAAWKMHEAAARKAWTDGVRK